MRNNREHVRLPLSDFQRLMLGWNEHQPFNVVDAVEVRRPVPPESLRRAAEAELAACGVAYPTPETDGSYVVYPPRPVELTVESAVPEAGIAPRHALAAHTTAEMNRAFRPGVDPLLRLWILQTQPHAHVGMTWQHWPCDGMAAGDLLRRILARCFHLPAPDGMSITDCTQADLADAFRPWHTWRRRLFHLRIGLYQMFRASRNFLAPRPHPPTANLRVFMLDLPEDVLARMQRLARPAQATINDVLATAILGALAPTIPARAWWKRRICLFNVVDLRPHAPAHLARKWGSYLAFCLLHQVAPLPTDFRTLLARVRRQSRQIKEEKRFFASLNALRLSRWMWSWLPRLRRWKLSRGLGSFSACVTNLRLPLPWYPPPWEEVCGSYWRAVALGSMVPCSFAATTFLDRFTLTMTAEAGSAVAAHADDISAVLRRHLTQLLR